MSGRHAVAQPHRCNKCINASTRSQWPTSCLTRIVCWRTVFSTRIAIAAKVVLFSVVSVCACGSVRVCQCDNSWRLWDIIVNFYESKMWSEARRSSNALCAFTEARRWRFDGSDVLLLLYCTVNYGHWQ